MPEEKLEDGETSENTENNEDTTSQKESESNSDDDLNVEDIKAKNRQLYERTKKAEQKAKEEEAKRLMLEKKSKGESSSQQEKVESVDANDIAKTVVALKDYSPDEIDYIFEQAKFKNKNPLEAAKDEDVQLFLEAKRKKKERELSTPKPSTKQGSNKKPVEEWTNEDLRKASKNQDWDAIDKFRKWAKSQ